MTSGPRRLHAASTTPPVAPATLTLRVNGAERTVLAAPNALLLDVLREACDLTGTKRGCDMGTCGCCTVIVDGEARLSCLTLARSVVGSDIQTIEGVGTAAGLDPIQRAYHELGASQCGFCTPGFIMATRALLAANPRPNDIEIREALAGNLCRCTGYVKIIEAVKRASEEMAPRVADRHGDRAPALHAAPPTAGSVGPRPATAHPEPASRPVAPPAAHGTARGARDLAAREGGPPPAPETHAMADPGPRGHAGKKGGASP
ncbi:MAG: (2Fe-2S)-binding protein [Thermoplasmatota archaeon]